IVTDQQTGQKIQIVTAMNPSSAPKQQFILTTADSSGASKVILASPETHNTKQVIFTAADTIMPGRIQVHLSHSIPTYPIMYSTLQLTLYIQSAEHITTWSPAVQLYSVGTMTETA
ncbi:hypothetical protein GOODEAATRI_029058, partial [Goodea atripinnis]